MGEYRVLYSNGDWGVVPARNYTHAKKTAKKNKPEGCSVLKVQKTTLEEDRDLRGYKIEFEVTGMRVSALGTSCGRKCTWHTFWPILARNSADAREKADEELERFRSNLATCISGEGVVAGNADIYRIRRGEKVKVKVETRGGPEINWGNKF